MPCFENHPDEFSALVRAWRARFGAELRLVVHVGYRILIEGTHKPHRMSGQVVGVNMSCLILRFYKRRTGLYFLDIFHVQPLACPQCTLLYR
jgi:hypothetical protein